MTEVQMECSILIRKTPEEIFSYFVEPELLSRFWLSRSEAPLQVGKSVRWEFMVPGAVVDTKALVIDPAEKISWEWEGESTVTIRFEPTAEGTRVHLLQTGFNLSRDSVAQAIESTQGFTIVLCDLKVLLETGRSANLVRDKAVLIQRKLKA